ncbi:MAG: electron transport complex protein RnfD [Enterobacterales bacterium]|jgi:electron transport complex protein RnfD
MMFKSSHSPDIQNSFFGNSNGGSNGKNTIRTMMLQVLIASLPGMFALFYFFGWGVLINLCIASVTAVATEALILKARNKDWRRDIKDSSALVTALLLGLALPPLVPWWITVLAVFFAIAFAKQLYGGLGYNPFNPAMTGYVLVLISFPVQMTSWSPASPLWQSSLSFIDTLGLIFNGQTSSAITVEMLVNGYDGFSSATPLDNMKTQLSQGLMPSEILKTPLYSGFTSSGLSGLGFAGAGWLWVNIGFLLGGVYLIWKRCIAWQLSASMLLGLGITAFIFSLVSGDSYASPLLHLFSGGTMLCAFFIVTDPVSAATSVKGRWIFGIGVGLLTWIIRTWGGYPDAIAFAILLMNMAAPTIDHYTKTIVYGHKEAHEEGKK